MVTAMVRVTGMVMAMARTNDMGVAGGAAVVGVGADEVAAVARAEGSRTRVPPITQETRDTGRMDLDRATKVSARPMADPWSGARMLRPEGLLPRP